MPGQLHQYIILIAALLLGRCAQVVPLTGGERDTRPPLLLEAVPASGATGFSGDRIVLKFDEYVQLLDLNNQLMISPRLRNIPQVSASGKEVTVQFSAKDLQPNTTYRLDFGKAIADMNESNKLSAFSYVFATGPLIDTLALQGAVTTASNNTGQGEVLVGLYRPNDTLTSHERDSLPFLLPPDYSARTDASGNFSFGNLPEGSFEIYAIRDNNRNNLYDGVSEKAAFGGQVSPLKDSAVKLRLFQEDPAKLFVRRAFSPFYGFAQIILNKPVYSAVKLDGKNRGGEVYVPDAGRLRDTIPVFYREVKDTLRLHVTFEEQQRTDTITIVLPGEKPGRRRLRTVSSSAAGGVLGAGQALNLVFPVWMDTASFVPSRLRVNSREDSLIGERSMRARWLDVRSLQVDGNFKAGISYELRGDTGMVRDLSGTSNDSNLITFRRQSPADLGRLTLKLMLPRKQAYVVQLINSQEAVFAEKSFAIAMSSANLVTLDFPALAPGTYRAKVIFDDNANGRWDTGDIVRKRQPEKVSVSTKELKLLADWEIEEQVEVRE